MAPDRLRADCWCRLMPRKPNGERALTSTERARVYRRKMVACHDLVERLALADLPPWSDDALLIILDPLRRIDSAPIDPMDAEIT